MPDIIDVVAELQITMRVSSSEAMLLKALVGNCNETVVKAIFEGFERHYQPRMAWELYAALEQALTNNGVNSPNGNIYITKVD